MSSESEINSTPEPEELSSVFMLGSVVEEIKLMERETRDPWHTLLVNSAEFIDWASFCSSEGLDIYAVPLNSNVAYQLVSPALVSLRNKTLNQDWFEQFNIEKSQAQEEDDGMKVELKPLMTDALGKLKERTGLDSDILFNHSPFIFHWAIRKTSKGVFIAAFDSKKEYDVWDSRFNKRYSRIIEEKMIDMVDPARTIPQPVIEPVGLAA